MICVPALPPPSLYVSHDANKTATRNTPIPYSEKVGKWFIQLCGTTPCMVNGAEEIRETIEKHLGIKEGGTWWGGECCVVTGK